MTDITEQLRAADRHLALSSPHLHPAPGPIRAQMRTKLAKAAAKAKSDNVRNKANSFGKQLFRIKKALQEQKQAQPPPPLPEERRADLAVRDEIRGDVVRAITRTLQSVAGKFVDHEKAARIEQSPAVAELLHRSTGWTERLPDFAQLAVVVGAKLLP